ncbi:hypothetical protein C5167_023941 [Papaver somniferum]|uniref:Uncharacterized protein n=1 Tax=Papaver somniferum TaxID=3469 RepID=A0A4Y7JM81_PAPSO|nr:hypothetical protein C5167_023941 [Papaver somniferum]
MNHHHRQQQQQQQQQQEEKRYMYAGHTGIGVLYPSRNNRAKLYGKVVRLSTAQLLTVIYQKKKSALRRIKQEQEGSCYQEIPKQTSVHTKQ